ncbi:protein-glutamate methylesterase/protein-glutamine glutaminase [Halioxenophilus aromaticivorans]|uniref:Protein-glutamate methylesterase/protein-glutamine glutaminase n=1 Tax=Halioxenophilus aromaticivorans TaxID=1306992 RepID=A0AAV3TZQ3_9ALTE
MPINVLVVDDSSFFRRRLAEIINEHPHLKVCGVATNGREAIELAAAKKPDVITMDYEMPFMDGLTAVREIMATNPRPILMLSSLTYDGARVTLDALDVGAVDFLPKNFADVSRQSASLKAKLHEKILAVAKPEKTVKASLPVQKNQALKSFENTTKKPSASVQPIRRVETLLGRKKILGIGASTGGPVALLEVLRHLPANFPVPILLIQHMPESFTRAFAERLDSQCNIRVHLAEDGMSLAPGSAYLAPGGQQMLVDAKDRSRLRIMPGDDRLNYKPSVDITFASAANNYQSAFLAMVLTGMGSDGCQGCRVVKEQGGLVWSQDQDSSVIYGMPMAVAKANLSDRVLNLNDICKTLKTAFSC